VPAVRACWHQELHAVTVSAEIQKKSQFTPGWVAVSMEMWHNITCSLLNLTFKDVFFLCVSWYKWRVSLFTVHFTGPGRAVSACLCVWTIHFTANNFLLGCLACWCTFTLSVSSLKVKITRRLWLWSIFWLFVELILCAKMVGVTSTEDFLVERVFVVSGSRRVSPVHDGWCLCFDCFDVACSVTARAYSRLQLFHSFCFETWTDLKQLQNRQTPGKRPLFQDNLSKLAPGTLNQAGF